MNNLFTPLILTLALLAVGAGASFYFHHTGITEGKATQLQADKDATVAAQKLIDKQDAEKKKIDDAANVANAQKLADLQRVNVNLAWRIAHVQIPKPPAACVAYSPFSLDWVRAYDGSSGNDTSRPTGQTNGGYGPVPGSTQARNPVSKLPGTPHRPAS